MGVAISGEVTVTAIEGDICDITTASYAYVNKETANVIPKVTVTAASDSSNTITNPMGPLRLSDSGDYSVSLKIYDSVTNEQLQMAGFYFSSVTLNVEAPIEASAKAQELLMGTKSSEVDPKQFVQDVKMGETTLDPDKYTAQFVEPFEVNQVAQTVKVQVASTKNAENATIIDVPIKGLWGNSIAFGGSYVNDITEAVATFTLQPADVPQITATYQYPDGEALIHGAGAFDGETYYSFDVFSMAGNERLVMPSVGQLGDQRFAAKGNEPVNVIDQWGKQPVAYGDIVRSYVVEPSRHWAVYGDEKVVKPYQPTKNSVVPKNSVFYEITENSYQPLAINYADISHNDGQALMISTATTNQELDAQLSKIMNIQGMPEDTEVKFLSYPSREKAGTDIPAVVQISEKLHSGKKFSYNYNLLFQVDEPLQASAKPQEILFGTKGKELDPKQFIQEVRIGDTTLESTEYTATFAEPFRVINEEQTVKVQVAAVANPSNTTIIDVPVKGLWGYSIAFGGLAIEGEPVRNVGTFTLHTGEQPVITATAQTGHKAYPIHSNFGKKYYGIDVFSMDDNRTLSNEVTGEISLSAKGTDTPSQVMETWGTQAVAYGNVIRSYSLESPSRHWLYTGNEQKQRVSTDTGYAYFEITPQGYQRLSFDQATIVTTKPVVTTETTDEELKAMNLSEYLEVPSAVTIEGLTTYPDRSKAGTDVPATVRVSQTLSIGKQIFYDYELKFDVKQAELTATANPQTIPLGTDVADMDLNNFVKEVKLDGKPLTSDEYRVEVVTEGEFAKDIKDKTITVKVLSNQDERYFTTVDVPVEIVWGHTILSRTFPYDEANEEMDAALSLLTKATAPKLVATAPTGNSYLSLLNNRPVVTFYRGTRQLAKLAYETVHQTPIQLADAWNQKLKAMPEPLAYGDLLVYENRKMSDATVSYNGDNTWVSRNNRLVLETKGYPKAVYRLTKQGLELSKLTEVVPKQPTINTSTTDETLDTNIATYLDLPENVTIDHFLEYPSREQAVKESVGYIQLTETLASGEQVKFSYPVSFQVNPVLEEQNFDETGNSLGDSKQTEFSIGASFQPAPETKISSEGSVYLYKGWLKEDQSPGIDTPTAGQPPAVTETTTYKYIYEKADNYLNIEMPVEALEFGTYDSDETIRSSNFRIKNRTPNMSVDVSLDSFNREESTVRLLTAESPDPTEVTNAARLHLLVDNQVKLHSLNETVLAEPIARIAADDEVNVSLNGKYFGDLAEKKDVQYQMQLKFSVASD